MYALKMRPFEVTGSGFSGFKYYSLQLPTTSVLCIHSEIFF